MTAAIMGAVGTAMALSPAAQGAADSDLLALLECDERSLTESGEVAYSVTDPPSYPDDYRSGATAESVAAEFVGDHELASTVAAGPAVQRSSDRVDFSLESADGRIVGIATVVDEEGGWRQGGGVVCAGQ